MDSRLTPEGLSQIMDEYKNKNINEIMEDLNKVPFFMTEMADEDNPQIEALKALAYDGEPHEVAGNFKNQGNDMYRAKNYKDAIVYYTKALDVESGDNAIEIACLGNRAQCNLELKNYRMCITDCTKVLERDDQNTKAWFRSAKAFQLLDRNEEAVTVADLGLQVDSGNEGLLSIKEKAASRLKYLHDLEEKRRLASELKASRERTLKLALDSRHITRMYSESDSDRRVNAGQLKFQLEDVDDATSMLIVPILFLYPLAMESDIFQEAAESDTLDSLVQQLFSQPPPWASSDYALGNLEVYAQTKTGGLAKTGLKSTLSTIIGTQAPDIITVDDMARFYIVPKNKAKEWISTWDKQQALSQLKE